MLFSAAPGYIPATPPVKCLYPQTNRAMQVVTFKAKVSFTNQLKRVAVLTDLFAERVA